MAALYLARGRFAEAEPLLKESLAIYKSLVGQQHPDVAMSLNNLAELYRVQGRYAEAEPLLKQSLAIHKRVFGQEHPDVATSLNNLAALYFDQGRYAEAEPLLKQSLAMRKRILGQEHPLVANSLHNLASLYEAQGRFAEAEPLLKQSLAIYKSLFGQEHPDVAMSLNNLAALYQAQGRYAEAETLLKQSLAMRKRILGQKHPHVATSLHNLAVLYVTQRRYAEAVKLFAQAVEIQEYNLQYNLIAGSETQKQEYITTIFSTTNIVTSLSLQNITDNPEAVRLALKTILQRKGRILDFVTNTRSIIRKNLDPETEKLLDRLAQVRTQQANLIYKKPETINPQNDLKQLKALKEEAEKLEDKISRRSKTWRNQFEKVTLERVQQSIPAEAVLVEFVKYYPFDRKKDEWDKPHYAAYILTARGKPVGIDLGPAEVIEKSISEFRKNLRNRETWEPQDSLKASAKQLEALIWQPLQSLLGNKKHILLAPDSALNLIPFEALKDSQDRYLVQNYSFTYLSSGRDLLRIAQNNNSASSNISVMVGDPYFDIKGQINAFKQNTQRSLDRGFARLPSTKKEVELIHNIWPRSKVFTGDRATEQLIKQLDNPQILHLATHGFFLPANYEDSNPSSATTRGDRVGTSDNKVSQENAVKLSWVEGNLLRSGIVFAGTNLRSSGGEDGILTALEATNLNLQGTQLVVLSACDTGLGEPSIGEGVYGLRRALAIAGTQSQMMSLWKVDDKVTQESMVNYYQKLKEGFGRGEALRQVQLEMIDNPQQNHPYYWASFIFSGDWSELK